MDFRYCNRNKQNFNILRKLGYKVPHEDSKEMDLYPFYEFREQSSVCDKEFVIMGKPDNKQNFISDKEMQNKG